MQLIDDADKEALLSAARSSGLRCVPADRSSMCWWCCSVCCFCEQIAGGSSYISARPCRMQMNIWLDFTLRTFQVDLVKTAVVL